MPKKQTPISPPKLFNKISSTSIDFTTIPLHKSKNNCVISINTDIVTIKYIRYLNDFCSKIHETVMPNGTNKMIIKVYQIH